MSPEITPIPVITPPLKRPPYGDMLHGQDRLLVFYGSQTSWDQAKLNLTGKKKRDAVAIPVDREPEQYDWRFVVGKSILVMELADTGTHRRQSIVSLLAEYASEVALLPHSRKPMDAVFWGCVE